MTSAYLYNDVKVLMNISRNRVVVDAALGVICTIGLFATASMAQASEAEELASDPVVFAYTSFDAMDDILDGIVENNDPIAVERLFKRTAKAIEAGEQVEFPGTEIYDPQALADYLSDAARSIELTGSIDAMTESLSPESSDVTEAGVVSAGFQPVGGERSAPPVGSLRQSSPVAISSAMFSPNMVRGADTFLDTAQGYGVTPAYVTTNPGAVPVWGGILAETAKRAWRINGDISYFTCPWTCTLTDRVKLKLTIEPMPMNTRVQWTNTNIPAGSGISSIRLLTTSYRLNVVNATVSQPVTKNGNGSYYLIHGMNSRGADNTVAIKFQYNAEGVKTGGVPGRTAWAYCPKSSGNCHF